MSKNQREFARVGVTLRAWTRALDEAATEALRTRLRLRPSVWSPSGEAGLREMVSQAAGSRDALLAQALLDISAQIVRLRSQKAAGKDEYEVSVVELSGGGGRLVSPLPLQQAELLGLRFDDAENDEVPPVRALIEIVHRHKPDCADSWYGFRFETIHPADQERMIRFLYSLQRWALRNAQA